MNIGISKDIIDIRNILAQEGQKLVNALLEAIEERQVIGFRNLKQSVEPKLIDVNTMGIYMVYYWKFQNFGVAGTIGGHSDEGYKYRDKKPPFKAMYEFHRSKAVPKDQLEPLSWALREHIYKYGFKAKHFVELGFEKYLKK